MIEILDPTQSADVKRLTALRAEGIPVVDTYAEQCAELAQIRDPQSLGGTPTLLAESPGERFVYYPWRRALVRIVGARAYAELRTNRNRELLTPDEQERFAKARIGFAGLNVGNPGAVCIALEGGARAMKLADFDPLSLTNLNRFRSGIPDLGVNKATLTARQILEIDPYYDLELYDKGLAPSNVEQFMTSPQLSLLVEETDALPLKISVRESAKRARIPVIMVTGNGEGVILDVERYDLEPELPILNGLLSERVARAAVSPATKALPPREKAHLARDFMGSRYLDQRLLNSFNAFGTTLVGIPQLAESSFMRGAALCYAAKAIILGRLLSSGRYSFSFSEQLKTANA
ncbi:ThiF family adenylyltransferase [Candidatus Kaiserbacteria bacterium]|nr:ThiF family adenylyltransferase [Candidatus Kaiserbacteria bacterium]